MMRDNWRFRLDCMRFMAKLCHGASIGVRSSDMWGVPLNDDDDNEKISYLKKRRDRRNKQG